MPIRPLEGHFKTQAFFLCYFVKRNGSMVRRACEPSICARNTNTLLYGFFFGFQQTAKRGKDAKRREWELPQSFMTLRDLSFLARRRSSPHWLLEVPLAEMHIWSSLPVVPLFTVHSKYTQGLTMLCLQFFLHQPNTARGMNANGHRRTPSRCEKTMGGGWHTWSGSSAKSNRNFPLRLWWPLFFP